VIINDTELNALMNESIRPKCTPVIEVTKFVGKNTTIHRAWNENTVLNLTYKRGVDPIGRTLPYMELVWTEPNAEEVIEHETMSKPEDFGALSKVTFTFTQYMDFGGESKKTVFMYPLWLVGTPVVNGNEVVWTARDMMYFLNNKQEIGFRSGLNFRNPLRYFLLDERASHKSNPDDDNFIYALQTTQDRIKDENELVINTTTVYDGTTKNLLKDIASTRNYFWDFDKDGMVLKRFSDLFKLNDIVHTFKGDTMKKYPDLTQNSNISAFSFERHRAKIKTKEEYTLTTPTAVDEEFGVSVNRYDLEDWGTVTGHENGYDLPNTINKVVYATESTESITVAPVSITSEELFVNNNKVGEQYSENNTCFYKEMNSKMAPRMNFLDNYFNEGVYTMQFECLPHFAVEPCDLVGVQTNIFENGERVIKKGIVVEQELSYNGAWTEKLIVHEVNANGTV
jgi:hypothetical protein